MKTLIKFFKAFSICVLMLGISSSGLAEQVSAVLINNPTVAQKNIINQDQKKIQRIMQQDKIPGVAVALVNLQGIIWAQGFGVTNQKTGRAVDVNTLFSIQSQTKMFTALGVMRAVQSGLLSLNEPIHTYLPQLIVYSAFEKNPVEKITLANLLSHTAGFAHDASIGNNFNSSTSFQAHIQSILEGTWLQFPVGQGYNYSNVGIELAGYILQIKSEKPFTVYLQDEVLNPLYMDQTTFDIQKFIASPDHADGTIEGIKQAPINYSMIPAAGMYSNVLDMSHYLQFQLNQGSYKNQVILNKNLLEEMLVIPFPYPDQVEGNALGIWKGFRHQTLYFSHLGRGFGFSSDLEWYPAYHLGVVVLMNKYDPDNGDIKIAHVMVDDFIKPINKTTQLRMPKNKSNLRQSRQQDSAQKTGMRNIEQQMLGEYISNGENIEIVSDKHTHEIALSGLINSGPTGNNITKAFLPLHDAGNNKFYCAKSGEYFVFYSHGITGVKTLQRVSDAYMWFYNQSAQDPFGPNLSSWKQYEGIYDLQGYGGTTRFDVLVKNGYLYLDQFKLRQVLPYVFIAANGSTLVFGNNKAVWQNLLLVKE